MNTEIKDKITKMAEKKFPYTDLEGYNGIIDAKRTAFIAGAEAYEAMINQIPSEIPREMPSA